MLDQVEKRAEAIRADAQVDLDRANALVGLWKQNNQFSDLLEQVLAPLLAEPAGYALRQEINRRFGLPPVPSP